MARRESSDTDESTAAGRDAGAEKPATGNREQVEPIGDPAALRERDDVDVRDRTTVHADRDHCEADVAGRVIVGVTGEDGVLLFVHEEGHVMLPNTTVTGNEDWTAAARREVEDETGVPVRIDDVERVRTMDHVIGEGGRRVLDGRASESDAIPDGTAVQNTVHQVVVRASPTSVGDSAVGPSVEDEEWTAGWYSDFPGDGAPDGGEAKDDVRLFLE